MYRSFTDRIFGGVCGGLPLNSWLLRLLFIVLTVASLGAFAVLYLMLWLIVPQESLAARMERGGLWLFVALLLTVVVSGAWIARLNGVTLTADGNDLYIPILGLLLSVVFFVRQVGR